MKCWLCKQELLEYWDSFLWDSRSDRYICDDCAMQEDAMLDELGAA
jgi:hypothetical protein